MTLLNNEQDSKPVMRHSDTDVVQSCPKCEITYNTNMWNDKCPNCEEQAAFDNGPWRKNK